MDNGKIGIFVVERQELFREGLLALLARETDLKIVGTSTDGDDALRRISLTQVDIILLDISVAYANGANIVHDLIQANPNSKVIALANHCSEGCVRTTLTFGIAGYALKHDSHAELMVGIRNVMQGKTYLSPSISQFVVSAYLGQRTDDTDRRLTLPDRRSKRTDRRLHGRAPGVADAITDRERQIIALIADGSKNKEIAKTLSISPKTVEKHRANLMKKLSCHSTSQLAIYALENGLLMAGFVENAQAQGAMQG